MVDQPRFLGIDEGPFRFEDATAIVVGVLTRGAHTVEAIVKDRVSVDGWDATHTVLRMARRLPGAGAQRILLDGITLGGMNLVDLGGLAGRLRVPVLGVTRREPGPEGLGPAAASSRDPVRRRRALPTTPPVKIRLQERTLWVQAHDKDASRISGSQAITELLQPAMSDAHTPEPLRLAHHIATAIVCGASGTSP